MRPKFFGIIRDRKKDLTSRQLKDDIISGIIVAIIALPLSVALAIASGVTPDKGLVTAIVAGFFISFLGGSRVQIGGPTGAFVVIIYGIIQKYGLDGLLISTILAGIIMIIMGLLRFGIVLKFIPYPTTTGFTAGIAVVLLSTQIKDFFGLNITNVPSEFIDKWISYINNFNTINLSTTLIGIVTLLIIIFWPRINKTIPGTLIALVVATILVKYLNLPVETIGSRFGDIPNNISLIDFSTLNITFNKIQSLISPSITIAFLAAIESLLSAVVADGMIGKKHNSNMELIAQGIANILSALFGGIPATGAIARTAANVKNGGRTPIAGMVHAITLLLIMLVFMPLAKLIPMTALAAILVVVSYNMADVDAFIAILKSTKSDSIVLVVTFILTVLFDLVIAIEVGMIIAMFLFVRKMSDNKIVKDVTSEFGIKLDEDEIEDDDDIKVKELLKEKIAVYEINGPFFYGVVSNFLGALEDIGAKSDVLILKMKNVVTIDASAINALKQLEDRALQKNTRIIYTDLNQRAKNILRKSGFIHRYGEDKFYNTLEDAILAAKSKYSKTS